LIAIKIKFQLNQEKAQRQILLNQFDYLLYPFLEFIEYEVQAKLFISDN